MNTILVIEDESEIRESIQEVLEHRGFAVTTAIDGYSGLKIAREQLPDLILCDVMLPEMDGYEVIRELRQDLKTANIPFVFLTARAERGEMRRGMDLGADDYLTKPFALTELLRTISVRLKKQVLATERYTRHIQHLENALDHLVHHDSLTQLPNQTYLQRYFRPIQTQAILHDRCLPLLVLGIDQYPTISQTLGQAFGQALLKAIAKRLSDYASRNPGLVVMVAYLQSHQFAVLLQPLESPHPITEVPQALLKLVATPLRVNSHDLSLTASIGIATDRTGQESLSSLLTQAEITMNHLNRKGGNAYRVYDPSFQLEFLHRLRLGPSLLA
ncbi:MAG: response regulator [Leptolyngbyaceae cyanobacterium bins.59]|nr:response regulator [Leptolyngbyaceae cyanobacterium bins.59]